MKIFFFTKNKIIVFATVIVIVIVNLKKKKKNFLLINQSHLNGQDNQIPLGFFKKIFDLFFSQFAKQYFFDIQLADFSLPNILFYARFCTKVVFPQPVCPTMRMLSVNLVSY